MLITGITVAMLFIVYVFYRQTVQAYLTDGDPYTVAKENLGVFCGLFVAAALMLDNVLALPVGIAAGVGAIISAIASLQAQTLMSGWQF